MSARDLGYFTGAFVGLLIAVILIWIFKKLRKGSCKQYDERQNLAKGRPSGQRSFQLFCFLPSTHALSTDLQKISFHHSL